MSLKLKIKPVMQLRGFENPYKTLVNLRFAAAAINNMLNCTPNDLIEWHPPEGLANPEQRALIKLKREREENMRKLLHDYSDREIRRDY